MRVQALTFVHGHLMYHLVTIHAAMAVSSGSMKGFCSRALHSADCRGYVLNRRSFKQRMIALPAETELSIKLHTGHDRYSYKLIRKLSPTPQLVVFLNNTSFLQLAREGEEQTPVKMFHCFISHLIFVSNRNQSLSSSSQGRTGLWLALSKKQLLNT